MATIRPSFEAGPRTQALPRDEIVRIVELSAFLHERLEGRFRAASAPQAAECAERRLLRWRQRVADGDETRFQKRLEWDGLSLDDARRLATGVEMTDRRRLPEWAELLESVLNRSTLRRQSGGAQSASAGCGGFDAALLPFADYASAQLRWQSPKGWRQLSAAARSGLEQDLLSALRGIAQEALEIEFRIWQLLPDTQRWTNAAHGETGQDLAAFNAYLWDGGMAELCKRYPVLARMLAERTFTWIAFAGDFLRRLEADRASMAKVFGEGGNLGRIAYLQAGLSDPHDGGCSVMELAFENGVQCFYKPHNIDGERRFQEILAQLNSSGCPLPFHLFRAVFRGNHGWCEAVRRIPCETEEEVVRYFTRMGMILCLVYLLEGSDFHANNIVAHGEFPVLVDMETLLGPYLPDTALTGEVEGSAAKPNRERTVFRTGILPKWSGEREKGLNVGALSDGEDWRGVCELTAMRRGALGGRPLDAVGFHRVRLSDTEFQDRRVNASRHVAGISDGFQQMYRFLMDRSPSVFDPLGEIWSRFLFRNTSVYWKILENCRKPHCLGDGLDVSIEAEVLYRTFLNGSQRPAIWPLLQAEQQSVSRGDVPHFLFDPVSGSLCTSRGGISLGGLHLESGIEAATRHLSNLSEEELTAQATYVRLAFSMQSSGRHMGANGNRRDNGQFFREALAIAETIESTGVTTPAGVRLWLTRSARPGGDVWQTEPMTPRLYDGVCGVGLFLAALDRAAGGGFAERARAAFRMVLHQPCSPDTLRFLDGTDLGAGTGVGSVVYALARAGALLADEEMIERAGSLAASIPAGRVIGNPHIDVVRGISGWLLALLTLHSIRPRPWLEQRALECGDALLALRDGETWRTVGGRVLCSFSHGAAGIGFALRRLSIACGDNKYAAAALAADRHDDASYVVSHANWPYRLAGEGAFRNTWCHGAAGMLLARLAAGAFEGTEGRPEAHALSHLAEAAPATLDHACCGNAGRIETLLEAGRRGKQPYLLSRARELAFRVIGRAEEEGGYRLGPPKSLTPVAFHQGLAGIGYEWLRLYAPDEIPSALVWE